MSAADRGRESLFSAVSDSCQSSCGPYRRKTSNCCIHTSHDLSHPKFKKTVFSQTINLAAQSIFKNKFSQNNNKSVSVKVRFVSLCYGFLSEGLFPRGKEPYVRDSIM